MNETVNEEKARIASKKELSAVEQLLKTVGNLSADEKLKFLANKYAILLDDSKSAQSTIKSLERQMTLLQREKEQIKAENGRCLLARSKFEELSRELQRQNKLIKEETSRQIREEEERRKEVSNKFQSTLSEVSALLQTNHDKNQQLREENKEMAVKLQLLIDQYSIREEHMQKLEKQYDLERQLGDAKLSQSKLETAQVKEKYLQEKQQLLIDLNEWQIKYHKLKKEEEAVRQNLSVYQEKYSDFQKVLDQSNDTFSGFKDQMTQLTKKIKTLEKETTNWRQRYDKSNSSLLQVLEEKKKRDQELLNTSKKLNQMEKLCRAMQKERTLLFSEMKINPASSTLSSELSDTLVELKLVENDQSAANTIHEKLVDDGSNVLEM